MTSKVGRFRIWSSLRVSREWQPWLAGIAIVAVAGAGAGWLADAGLGGYQPLRALVCVVGLVLALVRPRAVLDLGARNPALLAFAAWSFASILWTRSHSETFTTLAGLGGVLLFGVVLALMELRYDSYAVVLWALTCTSVASYLVIFLAPGVGTVTVDHPTEGTIVQPIGVFIWNSDLGFSAALGCVIALSMFIRKRPKRRWAFFILAAFHAGLVWISNAATAVLVLVAGLTVILLTAHRKTSLPALFVAVAGLVGGILSFGVQGLADRALGLLGRSTTLTGRVDLWESTLEQARDSVWLGKGAGVEPNFDGLSNAVHSHNGFVQIYFDRGLIGVALIVVVVIWALAICLIARRWLGLSVVVMVVVANAANNYLSYASFGLLLLVWHSYSARHGTQASRVGSGAAREDARNSRVESAS
ncbi:O-antigen ligase family protein [Nocardioides sp. S5]|uniref:O-antigen ligase family protein n=1 Tax=Nocardioides sp. S5 TaxID=2017486 RepID=UPI001A8E014E|nr:O-antigen ligase family protein [Nocardioides sp. S5]